MRLAEQFAWTRRGVRGVVVLGLVDVAGALLIAVLAFRLFGASSGDDTNPPVCYNTTGGVVSCALTPPVLMLPTFAIALLGLVLWQTSRRRRG